MVIRIPQQKVLSIIDQINDALSLRKITLRQLQSLTGSLAFFAEAMPSAFIRRLYSAMSQAKKPVSQDMHVKWNKKLIKDLENYFYSIQWHVLSVRI